MRDNRALAPPQGYRWLLRLASWIVPRPRRGEWRRKWEGGAHHWWAFLVERDELRSEAYAQLAKHCRSAWADALGSRFNRDDLRRFSRGPAFVLSSAAVFLIALGLVSGGFSGIRRLWAVLPYDHPEQLYDLLRETSGVPVRYVRVWREKSVLNSGMAAYYRNGRSADVTTDFFALLGVRPFLGRTLQAGDESAGEPPAVLNYSFWQRQFGGDRAVAGRRAMLDGRTLVVVGVLPRQFWALSEEVEYWTPLVLDPPGSGIRPPYLVRAITRLKPGVSPDKVRAELLAICRLEKLRLYGPGLQLLPMQNRVRGPLVFFAGGLVFALVIGAVLICSGRLFFGSHGARREGWRYWAFFLLKALLVLASLAALWIELTIFVRLRIHGPLRDILTALVFNWVFYFCCGGSLYWCFYDQRRRCPVCLHRLAMPVTIGSWSSPLLDPVSTELLCEQGHGSLCVPETQSSASEPDRWTALDDSWRELFTK